MNLSGVFAPVPTPFDADDRVDVGRLKTAFDRWVRGPLGGFIVLGSNGEAALLDEEESGRTIAAARESIPRHQLLIAGTGRESTRATVAATKRAAHLGADAVLVRTPGFFKAQMTNDVFIRHYTVVAEASPVPVLLYNFTAVTGVNLTPAAVSPLAVHPNIIGMKESGGDIAQIADLMNGTPSSFKVLAGSSSTFYAALAVGAAGGILALANIIPEACVRLFELFRQGDHEQARDLQRQILPLSRLLGNVYGVAGLKAALNLIHIDLGGPRPPLLPLPAPGVAALKDAIDRFQEVAV